MKQVFLVSGRDTQSRSALQGILEDFGLSVIGWEEAATLTGSALPHAYEVIRVAFQSVGVVVVLLTGDDEARLRADFLREDEREIEGVLRPQPRPNVLVEAGIALALYPKKTVIAQAGRLRTPSDLEGLQFVPLDESPAARHALRRRLVNAGCAAGRESHAPASTGGLPAANAGLPPARASAGVALMRRLRSWLPLPRLGGELEVVEEAKLGEELVISIGPGLSSGHLAVRHWQPGAATSRPVAPQVAKGTEQQNRIPIALSGPAGIHFFDLVEEDGENEVIARARLVAAEPD